MNWLKKVLAYVKRFWWVLLAVLALLLGLNVKKWRKKQARKELLADLERLKKEKEEKQKQLEEALRKLKEEAKEREQKDKFNNPDDAVDYLNDLLRRIQDNSKE